MERANPYDPEGIFRQRFANLIGGRYRMRGNYRIRRPRGTHDCLLLSTRAGLGRLRWPGGEATLPPDTLALYAPGTPQDYATDPEVGRWDFAWTHFRPPEGWASLLQWPQVAPGLGLLSLSPFSQPFRRRVQGLVAEVIRQAARVSPRGDAIAMNLLENLFLRCAPEPDCPHSDEDVAFVECVRAHIHANLRADLSVEALARHRCLSASRFAHRFTKTFGLSPRVYVENCRLEHAKRLLATGECATVKAAAYAVGFDSPSHFSLRFRLRYGFTPSDLISLPRVTPEEGK